MPKIVVVRNRKLFKYAKDHDLWASGLKQIISRIKQSTFNCEVSTMMLCTIDSFKSSDNERCYSGNNCGRRFPSFIFDFELFQRKKKNAPQVNDADLRTTATLYVAEHRESMKCTTYFTISQKLEAIIHCIKLYCIE